MYFLHLYLYTLCDRELNIYVLSITACLVFLLQFYLYFLGVFLVKNVYLRQKMYMTRHFRIWR